MKLLRHLILLLLIFGTRVNALSQTIFSEKYWSFENISEDVYDSLDKLRPTLGNANFDSLVKVHLVDKTKLFIDDLGADYYSYPYRISKDWMSENGPSFTEKEILWKKYKICFANINSGFAEETHSLYFIYDSLMYIKIVQKFGPDILQKARQYAKELDRTGQGFNLPCIKGNISVKRVLSQRLKYIRDDSIKCDRPNSVILSFDEKGSIEAVGFITYGHHGSSMPFACPELEKFKDRIKKDLNKIGWQPATFENKPLECTVALDRASFEMWFR